MPKDNMPFEFDDNLVKKFFDSMIRMMKGYTSSFEEEEKKKTSLVLKETEARKKIEASSNLESLRAQQKTLEEELEKYRDNKKMREAFEKEIADVKKQILQEEEQVERKVFDVKKVLTEAQYKQESLSGKKKLAEKTANSLREAAAEEEAEGKKRAAQAETEEERQKILEDSKKKQQELNDEAAKWEKRQERIAKIQGQSKSFSDRAADKREKAQEAADSAKEEKLNAYENLMEAKASGDEEAIKIAEAQYEEAKKNNAYAQGQLMVAKAQEKLLGDLNKGIKQVMDEASEHLGVLNARLQGTDKSFRSIIHMLDMNLAISPWVKTSDVLNTIAKLSDEGIAYNLELRAFLLTVAKNIATTFDAANGTLLRLVRLQLADTTAARLGMEAALTKFFNSQFNDTSYLKNLSDSVADALIEAESVRSYDEAMLFEYTVLKWLGSLSSLGVGQNAILNLAQGLGWIGSGNITQLQSSPMMTLFAMAASEADIDFAKLFTEGMDESDTNKLLRQIVMYLQEVNSGSGNLVVANALANVFGVTVSDLKGIANLTRGDISNIYKSNLSYSQALGETQSLLSVSNMLERVSMQTMINNIMENVIHNLGTTIGSSPFMYGTYKGMDTLRGITGGIHLPAISFFGNMLDLSAFTVEDLVQTGVLGISLIGSMIGAVSSLANNGGLDLGAWGGTLFNKRGGLNTLIASGISKGTSMSLYVGSGSGEDIKRLSLASGAEDEDVEEVTSSKFEDKWDFDKWLEEWELKSQPYAMPVKILEGSWIPVTIIEPGNMHAGYNIIHVSDKSQNGIASSIKDEVGKNLTQTQVQEAIASAQQRLPTSNPYNLNFNIGGPESEINW